MTVTKKKKSGRPIRKYSLTSFLAGLTGSEVAEEVLLYIAINSEGYPRAIASITGFQTSAVASQLRKLETCGILVRRQIGKTAIFSFNQRGEENKMFAELVRKIALTLPSEKRTQYSMRARPRQSGKEIKYKKD